MRLLVKIFIVVLLLGTFGCGTIKSQQSFRENLSEDGTYTATRADCTFPTPQIYGGTVEAAQLSLAIIMCQCHSSDIVFAYPFLFPFFIADIPLSFVADTIILPYTTYNQFKYGNINTTSRCR